LKDNALRERKIQSTSTIEGCTGFVVAENFSYRFSVVFFAENFYDMKQNEKSPDNKKPKPEQDALDIDKKIDRLQKKNEAETIAFRKLLNGLNKISKKNN